MDVVVSSASGTELLEHVVAARREQLFAQRRARGQRRVGGLEHQQRDSAVASEARPRSFRTFAPSSLWLEVPPVSTKNDVRR